MKTKFIAGCAFAALAATVVWAKDPVVMTVGGVDVPLSEFEYLYNKNSQQQAGTPQSIDEYAEIFKLYKMKVLDAVNEGIDTTAAFQNEYRQYRDELAAPYLTDSAYLKSLAAEAYERMGKEVEVKHIMRFKNQARGYNEASIATLDSIRTLLLNGADFADLASRYSEDKASNNRGGNMGFIPSPGLPYGFETVAYSLPEDAISEVIESPMAYHIIKGGRKQPAKGYITAQHILLLVPKDADAATEAAIKTRIDSIRSAVIENPNKFDELARELSDDKNSGRQGGRLGRFTTGMMVPEFEAAAFALADGEISEPVKSPFGYHIIRRISTEPTPTFEEMEPRLIQLVTNPRDERSELYRKHMFDTYAKKYGGKELPALKKMREFVNKNGLDSIALAQLTQNWTTEPVYSFAGRNIPASVLTGKMKKINVADPLLANEAFNRVAERTFYDKMSEYEAERLAIDNPAYANLLREFHDGSLLYEVSRQKVWDKASKDTEGLENYFNTHRDEFKWNEPRVKGILVQATNDSVLTTVMHRLSELAPDEALSTVRREFGSQASFERILMAEGANPLVDYLMFNGPLALPASKKYTKFFIFDAKKLDEPESFEDVRGQVVNAYQNELEQQWLDELQSRYPVKINKKVLKKVK